MKKLIAILTIVMLQGCVTNGYRKSELALTKGEISEAALIGHGVNTKYSSELIKNILSRQSSQIEKALNGFKNECEKPVAEKVAPGLIPILSAIPKLIYDIAADKKSKELEALKNSASSSYSVDFVIPKAQMDSYQCLIVIRHDKKLNIGAALAYDVVVRGELLYLLPKFMWASNTVANTKEVEKGKKEEIIFMSGASLQGIGKQDNGLPIIASTGEDSKKIGKFELGSDKPGVIRNGIAIGPIPVINNSSASILRVSVTEIGDLGFDVDERIARNKTIKEAIGTALSEGAKAQLEKD